MSEIDEILVYFCLTQCTANFYKHTFLVGFLYIVMRLITSRNP